MQQPNQYKQCPACGTTAPLESAFCARCGQQFPAQGYQQTAQLYRQVQPGVFEQYPINEADRRNKIAAGICGILLPGLGIHGFIIGNNAIGLTMLLSTILSVFLILLSFGLLAIILIPFLMVVHVIGFIQGILYLCASDQEFHQKYVVEKRWF